MPKTYCNKGFRKCVDGTCRKKKKRNNFSKKKVNKCKKGSRRCADLKCHKKK